jgi:hypothetical protein
VVLQRVDVNSEVQTMGLISVGIIYYDYILGYIGVFGVLCCDACLVLIEY